jgi:chemotaxis protein histidine kinase CheA
MFEDSAIVRFYYYVEDCCKLMRVRYTCNENGDVTLGAINEVRMTYIDIESPEDATVEINMGQVEDNSTDAVSEVTETNADISEDDKSDTFAGQKDDSEEEQESSENKENKEENSEEPKDEEDEEDFVEDKKDEEEEEEVQPEEPKDDEEDEEDKEEKDNFTVEASVEDSDPAHVTNVEITPTISEASVEDEQQTIQETSATSSTSFTESEREEFEALKREKKIGLVNSIRIV